MQQNVSLMYKCGRWVLKKLSCKAILQNPMKYFLFLLMVVLCGAGKVKAQLGGYLNMGGTNNINYKADSSISGRVVIHDIIIAGNRKTKDKIITREMSFAKGDTVLSDSLYHILDLNKKRLLNLSLFTDADLTIAKTGPNTIDVFVLVKEQWYVMPEFYFKLADRNFNVWWTEQNRDWRRANIGVTVRHRNFRGHMESLGISAQMGYTQRLGVEYFKPYIDRQQKHGAGVSFSYSNNNETYYTTDSNKLHFVRTPPPGRHMIIQFTAAMVYVYRPRYFTKHLFELRYRDYSIDDTVAYLNPGFFDNRSDRMKLMELTYRMDYNGVDNWNYPLTGVKTVASSVTKVGLEGFNFQHYFLAETGKFNRFRKKWLTAFVFRGRVSLPENQPYIFRSALGTESEYVRGYEYYVIDGSHYMVGRANLKYELLNISLVDMPVKYLSVIPIRIYPKIFADVGYVRNRFPGNSFLNNRALYSYGAGLDIVSTYDFKLRLEYTWNHLGEKGLFLHINSE